jgi:hypothetical protein
MGPCGFCKGFKALINHRFPSKFGVTSTSNERGYGIYDYKQAYKINKLIKTPNLEIAY